jgi:hypothetical protein
MSLYIRLKIPTFFVFFYHLTLLMAEIFNFERLILHCPDEASSIDSLQNRGILHQERHCVCSQAMNIGTKDERNGPVHKWRCSEWRCNKYRRIRPGFYLIYYIRHFDLIDFLN